MTERSWLRQILPACVILILLVAWTYADLRQADFINYDDPIYVTDNPHVQAGLSWEGIRWAFTERPIGLWHPLSLVSLMLDRQIYGSGPEGFHLTNVLLHAFVALLLFALLLRLKFGLWWSLAGAALFAVHPLRVESVAWISERKDLLCGLFSLGTLLMYMNYVRSGGWWRYASVFLLLLLALLSKPMAVTIPLVMLLLDWWPLKRIPARESGTSMEMLSRWKNILIEKAPMFALVLASCLTTICLAEKEYGSFVVNRAPLHLRIMLIPDSFLEYLRMCIFPLNLSVIYPIPHEVTWTGFIAASAIFLTVTLLCWWQRSRLPFLLVGWVWFVVVLLPVIGIIQVGPHLIADRYAYLPSIGILIAVLGVLRKYSPQRFRLLTAGACLTVILVFAWLANRQAAFWTNSGTLFKHALVTAGDTYVAHYCYSLYLLGSNRQEDVALQHLQKAYSLEPDHPAIQGTLARMLADRGDWDSSFKLWRNSLEKCPLELMGRTRLRFGWYLFFNNQITESQEQIQKALALRPDLAEAYLVLGLIKQRQGNMDSTGNCFRAALSRKPDLPDVLAERGYLLGRRHYLSTAYDHFVAALALQPDNFKAHLYSVGPLLKMKRLPEAETHAIAAVRLKPDDPAAYYSLGNVFAEAGRQKEAELEFIAAKKLASRK